MSPLCSLCESIQYESLPDFPNDSYGRTLSGMTHLQHLYRRDNDLRLERFGYRFHPDLESLRQSASNGCLLCQLIRHQANDVLSDVASLGDRVYDKRQAHPTFDMYVSKRPDGEDGIWVLSGTTWKAANYIVLVAAIAFGADKDDPLSKIFKGRLITPEVGTGSLDRVAGWISNCDQHHKCRRSQRFLPTRLVDVGAVASSSLRLVENPDKAQAKYIALSYCWGLSNPCTTTQETLQQRRDGIAIDSLPPTLRDAVLLTRRLGIQYLWVDSLCICQDDLQEWERESAQMASIYSNAYLVIAATGAKDANAGLFFSRTPPRNIQIPYSTTAVAGTLIATAEQLDMETNKWAHVRLKDDPLSTRAWGFQERVLSSRVLHFARQQIYFECLEGTVAENGLTQARRFHHASEKMDADYSTVIEQWYKMIREYGPRKLTFPSDKLPALTGIAKIYQQSLNDTYLAGLWKKSLHQGLCWQSLRCSPTSEEYRAPSWSWASVDGIPVAGPQESPEPIAEIIDCHVEVEGENPFGRVKGGWIKLRAPLVPLRLAAAIPPKMSMTLRTENGFGEGSVAGFDTIDRSYEVSAQYVRSQDLFGLVLVKETGKKSEFIYHSLIVTPTGSNGKMKRLGHILQLKEHFGPGDLEAWKSVTLV